RLQLKLWLLRQEGDAEGSSMLDWCITRPSAVLIQHVIYGAPANLNARSINPILPAAYPADRSHLESTTLSNNDN
ncbi:hypothetical protein COCVIDRAFT_115569, partial [Bipolaris victoriae FI3]